MTIQDAEPGIGEGPVKVVSVSLPAGTVRALRETTGKRGVSGLVAAVVEEHLRNRVTRDYLAEYEQEHGAFTSEEKQAAAGIWSKAEAL